MTAFDSVLEDLAKKKEQATQAYNKTQALIEAKQSILAAAHVELQKAGCETVEEAKNKIDEIRLVITQKVKEVEELLK